MSFSFLRRRLCLRSMEEKTEVIINYFKDVASQKGVKLEDKSFADVMDELDTFKNFRSQFLIPTLGSLLHNPPIGRENEECCYFVGNSLGLQPKNTRQLLMEELNVWERRGVNGHFDHPYGRNWVTIDETVKEKSAKLVGALTSEVAIMNSLTANLHLLMCAFYTPTKDRYKILLEDRAFPSDHFAFESQAKLHGFDPKDALLLVAPRPGEYKIRTEDILDIIEKEGDKIAVVAFSGVQYYSGQFFDIPRITEAGHKKGCIVGFDLAHAAGNVVLKLHDWNVDFACWCSYKYLNSGPGGIAGAFIHEKHGKDFSRNRLTGWWSHDKKTRFLMENNFVPQEGAAGFQLSNPSVLTTVALLGSLNVFDQTSVTELRKKSILLTTYLEYLLQNEIQTQFPGKLTIITPTEIQERGCQLSLLFSMQVKEIYQELENEGVVVDKREPNVLRAAPVPLYNTFNDVHKLVQALKKILNKL